MQKDGNEYDNTQPEGGFSNPPSDNIGEFMFKSISKVKKRKLEIIDISEVEKNYITLAVGSDPDRLCDFGCYLMKNLNLKIIKIENLYLLVVFYTTELTLI
jgi:hypothetical protein